MSDRPEPAPVDRSIREQQRGYLRRILMGFFTVIVLLPVVALGGMYALLLVPLLLVAARSLSAAMKLRASVREHGSQHR